jgi:hypothetical protein
MLQAAGTMFASSHLRPVLRAIRECVLMHAPKSLALLPTAVIYLTTDVRDDIGC